MKTLLALPLVLIGLAVPAAPSSAAADTCFGLAPTIVGTDDQGNLVGTAGPDVVVTGGAIDVDTLDGDDTVCITGDTYSLDAGSGNDRVDGTTATGFHVVNLGHGSDSYVGGGPRGVNVKAGDGAQGATPFEDDTIQTGPGPDEVITGTDGVVNADQISTGAGRDTISVRGHLPVALDAGTGINTLRLTSKVGGDWRIDNTAGTVTHDGVGMSAPAFTRFALDGLTYDSLSFRGGPADEVVDVVNLNGTTSNGPFSARMGAGQDTIVAHVTDAGPFVGGAGVDTIDVAAYRTVTKAKTFAADLIKDTFRFKGFVPVQIATLENFTISDAVGAVVKGDNKPNVLMAFGCGVVVDGRGGDDDIAGGAAKSCFTDESALGITAYGGAGNDRLRGSVSRDRLFGGAGRDRADGYTGRDQCVAEVRKACES